MLETPQPQLKELPPLLTAAEAAALFRVGVRTWRGWDAAAKVPRSVQIGHAKRWRGEELLAWIAAGCPERAFWQMEV